MIKIDKVNNKPRTLNQVFAPTRDISKKRLNVLWGFIGTNRTGKSSIARTFADIWKVANPDSMIVGFDPQKRFEDLLDLRIEADNDEWCLELHSLRNALIILDDYKLINEKNTPVEGLAKLMAHRADWNIDIIYITHNPALILMLLTYYTTHYFLFYTEAMDGSFQKRIMNYKLCIQGQRLINKYVRTYGRGEYPKFPYVVVDTEKRELFAYNFNKRNTGNLPQDQTKRLIQ